MTDERLRMSAEFRDRASAGLRKLGQAIRALGMMDGLRRLSVDMDRLERAGYRVGAAIGKTIRFTAISAAGAATVASAAMIKFGKASADSLDDLAAFSKQVGFSADSMRTLEGVAARYNVNVEGMRSGIERFNTNLGRLKANQGAFYGYLIKTNPALAQQFKHVKTTEEGYLLLFSALDKITDPSKRAAFVKAAGIGQESLRFLADGSLDLKATIEEVKKLQGYLGPKAYEDAAAYGDAMDNLGLSWRGLRDKLTAAALPAIVPMLEDLNKFFANNSEAIASGFREIAVEVSNGVRSMASWFGSLKSDDWKGFWNDLKGIASAISNVASTVNQVVQAMGGWKVLIGSLIALKVANWIKGLAGNLTDLLPGMGGTPGPADKKGAPWWAPGVQAWMYDQGKTWMMNRLDALPRPNGPGAVADPGSFDPWEDLKKIIGTWTRDTVQNKTADLISERTGQIAEAQSQLSDANSIIADMQRSGNDKKYPGAFERALQMRDSIQARIADLRAGLELLKRDGADVGRKMGEEAGKSFIDSIRSFFQKSSYSEGGVSNGGIVNASLRIGGGRAAGRAQAMAGRGHGVAPNFGSAKSMLDLIGTAEGTDKGRGYNETLAYGAYTGGDRNLVGMTLDEIDALQTQMLRHPGNRFNSSALGRYQFTRTRLRDLRKRYGIPGSARYDQNLQDQLAKLSLSERGGTLGAIRNEWEGLRNVPDDILRDAMRRDRQRKEKRQRDKVEGAASVDVRFHGTPAGTKVGAKATGLFREVRLDTGRSMKPATA